jgi:hypothetical protein
MKQIAGAIVMVAAAICLHGVATSSSGIAVYALVGALIFVCIGMALISVPKKDGSNEPDVIKR